jgi:hypothetical protein
MEPVTRTLLETDVGVIERANDEGKKLVVV